MSKGQSWGSEKKEFVDVATGHKARQLTDYLGHSHHLYFTNSGWYAGGKRLLFGSDRDNRTNLFSLDLESFGISQLTDSERIGRGSLLLACINPRKDEAYFQEGDDVVALDLHSLKERVIYRMPQGMAFSMMNCGARGEYLYFSQHRMIRGEETEGLLHGYVGFREIFEARPLCQIVQVPVAGGEAQILWEEKKWLGHVNTSPTDPDILSFCNEGPWEEVENRIWCLNVPRRRAYKVRPLEGDDEAVGHEYWFADGVHVGYHGRKKDGRGFFGSIRYDNTEQREVMAESGDSVHFHSNDRRLIVGDGRDGYLYMWRLRDDETYEGPVKLTYHRSSFHVQQTHVHPRLSPDGSYAIYTSDSTGYGNVYMFDLTQVK